MSDSFDFPTYGHTHAVGHAEMAARRHGPDPSSGGPGGEGRAGQVAFWIALAVIILVLAAVLARVDGNSSSADVTPVVELGPAGPRDGNDSIGLPVTAEPNQGLVDGQQIMVSGSGFPANTEVGIVQCSPHMLPAEGIARCNISRFSTGRSDAQGNVTAAFTVSRMLYFDDREIDCAAAPPEGYPASCTVAVGALDDYDVSGTGPLFFDPNSPIGPSAELELNLVDDLLDHQAITITIREPGAGVHWELRQCVAYRSPTICTGAVLVGPQDPNSPTTVVSADGSTIEATVLVRRMIESEDCGIEPEACSLVIRSSENGMLRSQRISFRTGMPLAPALIELLAPLPAIEGMWTELRVVNRTPGQGQHPLYQCPAGSIGLDGCRPVGEYGGSTADGTPWWALLTVQIVTEQGDVDCSIAGACILRYIDADGSTAAEIPIVVVAGAGSPGVPVLGSPDTTIIETDTTSE